ncbi:MAG TPA: DUF1295 domain-containing protein [Woeseiaceae bacterium]
MHSLAVLAFAGLAYGSFIGSLVWLLAFLTNTALPLTIDRGDVAPDVNPAIWNVLLLSLFGIQHSVMARPGFKRWWTRRIPESIERSCYVLIASLVLLAVCVLWKPDARVVWHAESSIVQAIWWFGFASGLCWLIGSSFLIDHFELTGLKQAWCAARARTPERVPFAVRGLYRLMRHPQYFGWLMLFWCTPNMTRGHLMYAAGMTLYTLAGIRYEERDLVEVHGDVYRRYRADVAALVPRPRSFRRALSFRMLATIVGIALAAATVLLSAGMERAAAYAEAVTARIESAAMERLSFPSEAGPREVVIANPAIAHPQRMLVLLHGAGGDAHRLRLLTERRFESLAEKGRWLVVYPQGYGGTWNDCRTRPDYPAKTANVDDVAFLEDAIKTLTRRYGIPYEQVLVGGFSNGGHMAMRLALERPHAMGGIAVVGAQLPVPAESACPEPTAPLNAMFMAGTADPVSPYLGGASFGIDGGSLGAVRAVDVTVAAFVRAAGFALDESVPATNRSTGASVEQRQWSATGAAVVRLYVVRDGGHVIPGSPRWFPAALGNVTRDVDFAEEVFSFMNDWPSVPRSHGTGRTP